MTKCKLLSWDEALLLYDLGLREIACVAERFGSECQEEAEKFVREGKWEPHWFDPKFRPYRAAALRWTYCIEVE